MIAWTKRPTPLFEKILRNAFESVIDDIVEFKDLDGMKCEVRP